jgi:uncharacterized protein
MKFPCTSCGACCRRAGVVARFVGPEAFPHAIRPDDSCSQLTPDNKCAVYETRPPICRIASHFEENSAQCNAWVREDGLPDSFLVKLG